MNERRDRGRNPAERLRALLEEDKLHVMAKALMKYETIDSSQVRDIMEGREPRPPEGWDDSGNTPPKDKDKRRKRESDSTGTIGGPASEH